MISATLLFFGGKSGRVPSRLYTTAGTIPADGLPVNLSGGLSVVMPVLNEGESLESTLRLLRGQLPGAELVVVDGGSNDSSVAVARVFADQLVESAPGRAVQMNAGAAIAGAQWLLFLHADSRLPDNAAAQFGTMPDADGGRYAWGFFPVCFDVGSPAFRVIAAFMNGRSRWARVATGDQGLLVSRATFDAVGGFPAVPLMEDVLITKSLKLLAEPAVFASPLQTSARRWQQHGIVKTVLLMWWLRLALVLGVPPHRLARWYGY